MLPVVTNKQSNEHNSGEFLMYFQTGLNTKS